MKIENWRQRKKQIRLNTYARIQIGITITITQIQIQMRHVAFLRSLSMAKKRCWRYQQFRIMKPQQSPLQQAFNLCDLLLLAKFFGPLPFPFSFFPRLCQPTLCTAFDILRSHGTNWTLQIRPNSFLMMHCQHPPIDFFRHDLVCNRFTISKIHAH